MVLRIISIVCLGCGSGAGNGNSGILATKEETKDDCCRNCKKMSIDARCEYSQKAVWVLFKKIY